MVCILKTKKYAVVSDKLFAYIPHFRQHNSCCFCFYLCYALMERQYMEIFCPFPYIVQKTVRKTLLFHVNVLLGLWDLLQDIFCVHTYTLQSYSLSWQILNRKKEKKCSCSIHLWYWHANYLLTHDISGKLPFASFCNNIPNIFNVK